MTTEIDHSLTTEFSAILNRAAKPTSVTAVKSISAKQFLQGNNRASTIPAQKELIVAYTGTYNLREPHGVQLDNAVRMARNETRPVQVAPSKTVKGVDKFQTASYIVELLKRGQDLKARIANAEELQISTDKVQNMKAELDLVTGQLECAAN